MSGLMCQLLWCISHLVVALIATWWTRRYALHRGLFDLPGERRSHSVATPRGGGVAIVLALLLGCIYAGIRWPLHWLPVAGFACGLAVVAAVGWCDDHRPLSALFRFSIHVLASLWLGWLSFLLSGSWVDASLAALAAVVLINVWNFMDGIDGLATTQAMLAAAAYSLILPGETSLAALALLGACGGFLPFNFPKARIFMGDGGSGALGYTLAGLLALSATIGKGSWCWVWLPLSVFLIDAGLTLAFRILTRQRWWEPHAQHLYQVLARRFGRHAPVTLIYACFSMVAISLYLLAQAQSRWSLAIPFAWLLVLSFLWLSLRRGIRT